MAWLLSARRLYLALPAFLAQASLQNFFLLSNVVKTCLQTGHFFSIQIASFLFNTSFMG
jgi:hypothetical protein